MLIRVPVLLFLLSVMFNSVSLIIDKFEDVILLGEDPLQLASLMIEDNRLQEAVYLADFSKKYLAVDSQLSSEKIEKEAIRRLDSKQYLVERFIAGALTGEANNTPELIGSLMLDMLVIGDIRDLVVQGYREYDTGDGDEVIAGLSAAGLLLTLAPELSWAPALFKNFWRAKRFSPPFQRLIKKEFKFARNTGDYGVLKKMLANFSDVITHLGMGPTMGVMKAVKNSDDLAVLALKTKFAPAESYTLSRIDGIKSLNNISILSTRRGKLLKSVKVATRQQKIFAKAINLIPLSWLVIVLGLSILVSLNLIYKSASSHKSTSV